MKTVEASSRQLFSGQYGGSPVTLSQVQPAYASEHDPGRSWLSRQCRAGGQDGLGEKAEMWISGRRTDPGSRRKKETPASDRSGSPEGGVERYDVMGSI